MDLSIGKRTAHMIHHVYNAGKMGTKMIRVTVREKSEEDEKDDAN